MLLSNLIQTTYASGFSGYSGPGAKPDAAYNTASGTFYPVLTSQTTGGTLDTIMVASSKISFDAATGALASTTFNSTSDAAAKDKITEVHDAMGVINKLQGVEFVWKDNGIPSSGVIAQQVEPVLPHLVGMTAEGYKSVNYDGLVAYLIESIKELNERVVELEARAV